MDIKGKVTVIVAFLELFLLVSAITIYAKEIGDTNPSQEGYIKLTLKEILEDVLNALDASGIPSVSAYEESEFNLNFEYDQNFAIAPSESSEGWNCCFETFDEAICQDVPASISKNFCSSPIPTKCSKTRECSAGCCYDPTEGVCSTRATKYSCESLGGVWKEEVNCLIQECEKGCCSLGKKVEFTTKRRCELLSMMNGYQINFKDSLTELDCIALSAIQEEGACILSGKNCIFSTKQECVQRGGEFKSGKLCSNLEFENNCKKQSSIGCVDGKDEIYWFDSCGNRENIYSSDRNASWNEGMVLPKWESCGSLFSNANSNSCGNCDRWKGSVCSSKLLGGVVDGNYICRSMNCIDENGKTRTNGESWCAYDGIIGEGRDVVGSRHWKRICQDGEIIVEPCADYRGQVCVQSNIEEGGKTYSSAQCVVNDALSCLEYNSEKDPEKKVEKCEENPHCFLKNINVDKGFKFDMCVSQYPRGFDLSYLSGQETAKGICGYATQECIVYYEKKITGWDCVFNCHCEDKRFVEQMNDLCISLGDCGGYVNILGKGTDSFKVEKNKHKISYSDYSQNSKPIEGQCAAGKGLGESMDVLGISGRGVSPDDFGTGWLSDTEVALKYAGMVTGATASILKLGTMSSFLVGEVKISLAEIVFEKGTFGGKLVETSGLIGEGGSYGPFLNGALEVLGNYGFTLIVATVASMIAVRVFKLSGDAALVTTIAGVAAAVVASSVAWAMMGAKGCLATGFAAFICIAVVIIVVVLTAVLMKVLGIGKTKEIKVKYECLPWQAPFAGDDCSKCNEDPLKPCSKYRCESLGKACGLIDENTQNPKCVAKEGDRGIPPKIEISEVSEGYSFRRESENKYSVRKSDGSCIPEFTTVIYKLETDRYSQCKFDLEDKDYELMEEYLLEGNMFELEHLGGYMMPSIDSMAVYNVEGDIREKMGNSDIYIRCIDYYGRASQESFVLNFCLNDGPDETPPMILAANPPNNAYLKKGVEEIPFSVFLNEPAECRIDVIDRDYDIMEVKMDCGKEIEDLTSNGWECKTKLTGITREENKFYIKCKDQPWLEGTEEEGKTRNANENGTEYTLYLSKSDLKLKVISPSEKNEFGHVPALIKIELETSEGYDSSGRGICKYGFSENEINYQFYETGGKNHVQTFDTMLSGEYKIYVGCKDYANNEVYGEVEFEVILDDDPPTITRLFSQGSSIRFITDEEAICYYGIGDCEFNIENATKITWSYSKEHQMEAMEDIKYYIKCEDKWNNANPYCARIISKTG